jgi:hypothetical protein
MAKPHDTKPGETMLSIAKANGFLDYRDLWNDPANAALKKARVNPFSLVPKDIVTVVDLEPKTAPKATGQFHTFTLQPGEAVFRLKLLDPNGKPITGRTCKVLSGRFGPPVALDSLKQADPAPVTDGNGIIEVVIARDVTDAKVEVLGTDGKTVERAPRARIGFLPPVNSAAGQRARLNQLGLYAGFAAADTDQLRWAIEEFEHLHQLPVKGRSDNPAFFNKLGHVHGDLLASEQLALPLVATEPES